MSIYTPTPTPTSTSNVNPRIVELFDIYISMINALNRYENEQRSTYTTPNYEEWDYWLNAAQNNPFIKTPPPPECIKYFQELFNNYTNNPSYHITYDDIVKFMYINYFSVLDNSKNLTKSQLGDLYLDIERNFISLIRTKGIDAVDDWWHFNYIQHDPNFPKQYIIQFLEIYITNEHKINVELIHAIYNQKIKYADNNKTQVQASAQSNPIPTWNGKTIGPSNNNFAGFDKVLSNSWSKLIKTTPPTKPTPTWNGKQIGENNNPFNFGNALSNIGKSTKTTPPTNKETTFIKNQNQLLQNEIIHTKEIYSTDDQKNYYLNENLNFYKKINYYLLIIYFIFAIIIAVIMFLSMKYNVYVKIGYIIFFAFFPLFIFKIEIYIYNLLRYMYALINGEVYKRKSFISE